MTHPIFKESPLNTEQRQLMVDKGVWKPSCPVSLDRLNVVHFSYHTFKGEICHAGQIVVMDAAAPHVANIFRHLFLMRFPIHSAKPIEHFDGSDDASMAANNTSAFNYRKIAIEGNDAVSIHSYGLAVDVNPVQNPYAGHFSKHPAKDCGQMEVWPTEGLEYMNRGNQRPGMVEEIVDTFAHNGFKDWGGSWNDLLDYHHFQTPRILAELLAEMDARHAIDFFDYYVLRSNKVTLTKGIIEDYKNGPNSFLRKYGIPL